MNSHNPYLSAVVVTRNDEHGGGLRERTQAFINGWTAQCERHRLPAELIVVEWNPPADRPPLAEAFRWPRGLQYCSVRIIQVPPEVHARYQHAAALPLYQMIGKNAGIRRAAGEFVLATNIDILFSDELMEFLALRRLDAARMYRIDRHDVMTGVPEEGIDEQLAYCRTRLIRLNARDGTFKLTPEGERTTSDEDIAPAGSGITFGEGWFPAEQALGMESFRWAADSARIDLKGRGQLVLELEPGPSLEGRPLELEILDASSAQVGRVTITGRSAVSIPAPAEERFRSLTLRTLSKVSSVALDPRVLSFRAFSCYWDGSRRKQRTASSGAGVRAVSEKPPMSKRLARDWGRLQHLLSALAYEDVARLTVRAPYPVKRLLRFYCDHGGVTGLLLARRKAAGLWTEKASDEAPLLLHTNACGDFTLMAREKWFDLRGYPEFDAYSMHIDSLLCYAAHHAGVHESILPEPMRIFHIEHGSGWTPEGEAELFARLAARGIPFIRYSDLVGWASQMRRLECPMIFNNESWGLAGFELAETRLR